jgi:predicted Zn-dependent protease
MNPKLTVRVLSLWLLPGYDPNPAIAFWQRMAQTKKGSSPPEFLSTHPADTTRINAIRSYIPEAMSYRR